MTRRVRPRELIEADDEVWWWDCRRGEAGWAPVDPSLIGQLVEYRRVRRICMRLVED